MKPAKSKSQRQSQPPLPGLPPPLQIPQESMQQWRRWIEKEIGGPSERIESATQAVVASIALSKSAEQIVSAARSAAADWDSQHGGRPAAVKTHLMLKVVLTLVVLVTTVIIVSQFRYPLVIWKHEAKSLGLVLLVDMLAVFVLIRLSAKTPKSTGSSGR
jgi:hypothetical protein